jgi:hypothetical protein
VGPTSQMSAGSWISGVIQCFGVISLLRGVDPRGVDLPKVMTLLLIFSYLECCFRVATLLKLSTTKIGLSMHSSFIHCFCSLLGS